VCFVAVEVFVLWVVVCEVECVVVREFGDVIGVVLGGIELVDEVVEIEVVFVVDVFFCLFVFGNVWIEELVVLGLFWFVVECVVDVDGGEVGELVFFV